ncbi:interferon-induced gtp-binding protein mx2 [Colletotrichum karsti]|uniref:Interferon-induced gtp-binding protein mx2 n=1 Tax=Colletotrichum karsti TaxID=1095194 RepID=A0A9P6LN92_9PEZI|nr:interferon-induced gtp-binding protein mx2 [Colletotrichum karsti]KAF9882299.1 interferon-induced gtp-binding protein mx2 [Colletotrichum karsti]
MASTTTQEEQVFPDAAEYLSDPRFHQSFTLPADPSLPPDFKVTYSDYGFRDAEHPDRENVLLWCSGLLGSRYLHIAKDSLAKRHKVRIIDIDRPGFGGTTPVPNPGDRVRAWVTIVPALLAHLNIRHVCLAAHSGGAIYALNTLLYLRHLLSPARPYVAIITPWVHTSHSGAPLLTAAGVLPESMVGALDKVAGFINRNLAPAIGFSGAAIGAVSDMLPSLQGKGAYMAPGVDVRLAEFEQKIWKQLIDRVYSENVEGLGQDARLLLKRTGHEGFWGEWNDHDQFVPLLAEKERELNADKKLRVEIFFAESDALIGTGKGPEYFDKCWTEEKRGDRIEYKSCVVPKSDHDGIVSLRFGVFEQIIRRVAGEEEGAAPATTTASTAPASAAREAVVS